MIWWILGVSALAAAALWFASRKPEDRGMSSGVADKTKRWGKE